jgi:hypothetical protein
MEQLIVLGFLTLQGLKAKEIGMELTTAYGNEKLQISAVKQRRRRFLQGRREFGDGPRSGRPVNSSLA